VCAAVRWLDSLLQFVLCMATYAAPSMLAGVCCTLRSCEAYPSQVQQDSPLLTLSLCAVTHNEAWGNGGGAGVAKAAYTVSAAVGWLLTACCSLRL
jgi:hypothetical protein